MPNEIGVLSISWVKQIGLIATSLAGLGYLTPKQKHKIDQIVNIINDIASPTSSPTTNNILTVNGIAKASSEGALFSYSMYKFPRNRIFLKKSSFDKINCAHGTFYEKELATFKADLSGEYHYHVMTNKTTRPYFNSLFDKLPNRTAVTQPAPITGYGPGDYGGRPKIVEFVWQKQVYRISNADLHPVELDIFEFQPVNHIPTGGRDPIYFIEQVKDREGNADAGGPADGLGIKRSDNFANDIFYCKDLYKHWKMKNATSMVLQPGQQHEHVQFHAKNFVFNEQDMYDDLDPTEVLYMKHYSTFTILRTRGRLGHIKYTDPTTAARGAPVFNGDYLDVCCETTTYAREHLPFFERFKLELTGNIPYADGRKRSDFEAVELHAPADIIDATIED